MRRTCLLVGVLMSMLPFGAAVWAANPKIEKLPTPRAEWKFDRLEADGSFAESGSEKFPIRPTRGVSLVEGKEGSAVDCRNAVMAVASELFPDDLAEFTVMVWVRPRDLSGFRELLRLEHNDQRFLFSFQNEGAVLSLGLNLGGEYLECDATTDRSQLLDGDWHFVAATYDGDTLRVWLDGCEIGSLNRAGAIAVNRSADAFIGSSQGGGEFFDGALDTMRFYDRALSASELESFCRPDYIAICAGLLARGTEFRPLTDAQRERLSASEKIWWEEFDMLAAKVATLTEAEKRSPQTDWPEMVAALKRFVKNRPVEREPVAPYRRPETPPVVDRSESEARAILQNDWLFQCDGNPSKERILLEILSAGEMADRLEESDIEVASERLSLAALTEEAKRLAGADEGLYFRVRELKRGLMFKNPVIDFDSVLYVDMPYPAGGEWRHETRHRLGYMAVPGGRLMTLTGLSPAGRQKMLLPQSPLAGSFWRPDLSFDGTRVLVSFKPHNESAFHLYEIGIDGNSYRQLTGGIFDDFDPIYLPNGEHVVFSTTRGHTYVRCMPPTNAYVLARMKLDSSDLYLISRNNEPDYLPSVLHDGRIVFSRWEYTDKPLWRCVSLWTMNPDGTQTQVLWGNQSVWPDLPKDVRAVPDSGRLIFTGSAHHDWFSGSIALLDPSKGLNFPDGLTKVTAEIAWPETGNGPVDPIESVRYHRSGNYEAYDSPYPLSEREFLVSARRGGSEGKYVLLLMDTDGNRELIYEGTNNIFYAQPIRPRAVPPVIVDRVKWPKRHDRDTPAPGVIYSNNVYDNAPPELFGKAKSLRIFNIEPKTYTFWNHREYISTGPAISMVQSEGVKRILGTVPIESDGSVSFYAPSGVALHFQLLDEEGKCLQTMRSFTGVMPGEQRGCLGCHASQITSPAPQTRSLAVLREPSTILPPAWDDISVSYERYVQPVLDKHCASCHSGDGDAKAIFDTTLRPGFLHFKEPYITLIGNPSWGTSQQTYRSGSRSAWNQSDEEPLEEPPPGFGIADTILVEAYDQTDPAGYATPQPMERLSYASRLVNKYCQPEHYGVQLSPTELQRVIVWVDAICPYMGTDDVRRAPDPEFQGSDWLAIRPRLETAPVVPRPGPFDPFGDDDAYAPPSPQAIYGNPAKK